MRRLDANVILRYLLDDHPELSQRATEYIEQNQPDSVFISKEVLCEVVYVLGGVYSVDRAEIVRILLGLIASDGIIMEHRNVVAHALSFFKKHNIDFVDSFLCAYHLIEKDEIFTFDKKLKKLMDR